MFSFSKSNHVHQGRLIQKWTFNAKSPLLSGATVVDVDGDGRKEILFGTKSGKIYCLDDTSNEKWTYAVDEKLGTEESFFYDSEKIDSVPATPTITDITGDGKLEIIFGTELGVVYCLTADGRLLWKHDAKSAARGRILVADIDNDGNKEILFGTIKGEFLILDHNGKARHSIKIGQSIQSEPALLTQGQTQILFGSEDGKLHSFSTLGKKLWEFKAKDSIRAKPVFGSLVSDMDIIVGDNAGMLYCLDVRGTKQWEFATEGAILGAVTLADVNADDNKEVIFGSCDNKVYCLTHRGERIWSYETDFWIVTPPVVVDIDGDGAPEVIAGSFDQNVYVLDGEGAYSLDYMPGLAGVAHQAGHYTDVLTSEPGEQLGKRLWQLKTQGMVVGCEVLEKDSIIVNVKSGFVDDISHSQ